MFIFTKMVDTFFGIFATETATAVITTKIKEKSMAKTAGIEIGAAFISAGLMKSAAKEITTSAGALVAAAIALKIATSFLPFSGGGITTGSEGLITKGATGFMTTGLGNRDTIPALLKPKEVVLPLDRLPSLLKHLPQESVGESREINVYFYQNGNIETVADYQALKQDLTNTIKNATRGN